MDTTFHSTFNRLSDNTWQDKGNAEAISGWLGKLFGYPEISKTDNRVAEYLPPAEWSSAKR